jgi:hypothetical protein
MTVNSKFFICYGITVVAMYLINKLVPALFRVGEFSGLNGKEVIEWFIKPYYSLHFVLPIHLVVFLVSYWAIKDFPGWGLALWGLALGAIVALGIYPYNMLSLEFSIGLMVTVSLMAFLSKVYFFS